MYISQKRVCQNHVYVFDDKVAANYSDHGNEWFHVWNAWGSSQKYIGGNDYDQGVFIAPAPYLFAQLPAFLHFGQSLKCSICRLYSFDKGMAPFILENLPQTEMITTQ